MRPLVKWDVYLTAPLTTISRFIFMHIFNLFFLVRVFICIRQCNKVKEFINLIIQKKYMKLMNLNDLFENKICALYDIETSLVKAIPKMAKAASDPDLKNAFNDHLMETRNHVLRLEKIFSILGVKPKKLKAEAIRGLIADGEWVTKNVKPYAALDANLARAAQYVEHYEIAGYTGAISWAEDLQQGEIQDLLKETLAEEKAGDEKLGELGERLQKDILQEQEQE